MADLLDSAVLAVWTDNDPGDVAGDPKAQEIIRTVSRMACFLGGHDGRDADHPEWVLDPGDNQAPYDVQLVVLQVCKRSYENTRQVVQEGNVGPIGGDTFADAATLLLELTDSERATLTKYNEDGDPDGAELWVLSTTRGDETIVDTAILYAGDNNQVGLETSADPREWKFPLFGPGDPGDPNLYPDEV